MRITLLRYTLSYLALTISSCGLMKKTEKKVNESKYLSAQTKQMNEVTEASDSGKTIKMVFEKDDMQSAYSVQLWPKGSFRFSAENGFEGEAERILISGQMKEERNRKELSGTEQQHSGRQEITSAQSSQEQGIKKEEIREIKTDFKWVILGIMVIIACFTWVYYKFLNK